MYKKFFITGASCKIGKSFIAMLPKNSTIYNPSKKELNLENIENIKKLKKNIINSDVLVLLHSIIIPKSHLKKNLSEKIKQIKINLLSTLEIVEIALKYNKNAKIFILGSESGKKGSYDIIYSLTKAALHKYIEERKILFPKQQLVGIAPSTIIDGKITLKRKDKENVKKSINLNPKKRGIFSNEISKLIYSLVFFNTDYISNIVIDVNGGKFSRM
ncbi:hypothetical protein OAT26_01895 [Candidatus Pelagibacter sp.]|jgi:hypothetical protein|nr:hypothetical protein [Candidatus Pelagibacter sp.]